MNYKRAGQMTGSFIIKPRVMTRGLFLSRSVLKSLIEILSQLSISLYDLPFIRSKQVIEFIFVEWHQSVEFIKAFFRFGISGLYVHSCLAFYTKYTCLVITYDFFDLPC